MRKPLEVFIVIYSHRHGTDVWLRRTKESARLSILIEMAAWESELESRPARRRLLALVKAQDFDGAMKIWTKHMPDEFFEIRRGALE